MRRPSRLSCIYLACFAFTAHFRDCIRVLLSSQHSYRHHARRTRPVRWVCHPRRSQPRDATVASILFSTRFVFGNVPGLTRSELPLIFESSSDITTLRYAMPFYIDAWILIYLRSRHRRLGRIQLCDLWLSRVLWSDGPRS